MSQSFDYSVVDGVLAELGTGESAVISILQTSRSTTAICPGRYSHTFPRSWG